MVVLLLLPGWIIQVRNFDAYSLPQARREGWKKHLELIFSSFQISQLSFGILRVSLGALIPNLYSQRIARNNLRKTNLRLWTELVTVSPL